MIMLKHIPQLLPVILLALYAYNGNDLLGQWVFWVYAVVIGLGLLIGLFISVFGPFEVNEKRPSLKSMIIPILTSLLLAYVGWDGVLITYILCVLVLQVLTFDKIRYKG